jgi:Ca2+-binding RTX toxin-like protein
MACFDGTSGDDNLVGSEIDDRLYGLAGSDQIDGQAGGDFLDGGLGDDTLAGGAGDDVFEGGGGADTYSGGPGTDTLLYEDNETGIEADFGNLKVRFIGKTWRNETFYGVENLRSGLGADRLLGDEAANVFHAGDGADYLWGAGGDDLLLGGKGDDELHGGDGDDTFDGGGGTDSYDGGNGSDTVLYDDNETGIEADLAAGTVSFVGKSWRRETLVAVENVRSGDGADRLLGDDADNAFFGGRGDDLLSGGHGDDVLQGGGGTDSYDGGAGHDTVSYADLSASVSVRVHLGTGITSFPDRSWRTETLDRIEGAIGGRGDDILIGDHRANTLNGRHGDDTVRGRGGDDTFIFSRGADRFLGGGGEDTLLAPSPWDPGFSDPNDVDADWGSRISYTIDLGTGRFAAGGEDASSFSTRSVEVVETGAGDDIIAGSNGDDIIRAGNGANRVDGGKGDDVIYGGQQSDSFFAYADWMSGGETPTKIEILKGGSGNDYIYSGGNFFYVSFRRPYGETYFTGEDRLLGGAGDDVLAARLGTVLMEGGDGADTFSFTNEMTEAYGSSAYVLEATRGRIKDFDPAEGDRIKISLLESSVPAAYLPSDGTRWIGTADPESVGDYGYWRDGQDSGLFYAAGESYVDERSYLTLLTVQLEGFTDKLSENDVLIA